MAARLNHTKNVLYFILHVALMTGVAMATIYIAGPWISLAVGIGALLYTINAVREHTAFVRTQMARHPEAHEFSPNLKRIVAEVCAAANINPDAIPIYDYRTTQPFEKLSKKDQRLAGSYFFMGRSHNAATADAAGDVLMVSAPLLKLLDDGEEKAIFGHEVAHIALHHVTMALFLLVMRRFVTYACMIALYIGTLSAGWVGAWTGYFTVAFCWLLVGKLHPGGEKFLSSKNRGLTTAEIAQKARAVRIFNFLIYFACVPVFVCFAPAFLKTVAGTYFLSLAGGAVQGAASRSREYQADAGAVKLGAGPLAMVTALRKIYLLQDRANAVFTGSPTRKPEDMGWLDRLVVWYRGLFATHPKGEKRLARLCAIARRRGVTEDYIAKAHTGEITLADDHDIPQDVIRYYARAL